MVLELIINRLKPSTKEYFERFISGQLSGQKADTAGPTPNIIKSRSLVETMHYLQVRQPAQFVQRFKSAHWQKYTQINLSVRDI